MKSWLYELLLDTWIYELYNRFVHRHQMRKSASYYSSKTNQIDKIASWLIDDKSRMVYRDIIEFRCNLRRKYYPPSDIGTEYFDNEYFSYGESEVFLDCGAYYGDTVSVFKDTMAKHGVKWKRIIAFEPDNDNYNSLVENHKDIKAINAGVWSEDGELLFDYGKKGESQVVCEHSLSQSNHKKVLVRSIDDMSECDGVTFIKMDVEGAELLALKGAYNTIEKYKPKLAICIYHSDEEMLTIPEWIHENFPEYKLFVRHHQVYPLIPETVLYAFVD